MSHGVGEHCSRYEEFGSVLARQGFLVVSHDHGKFFIYLQRMNCPSFLYVPGRGGREGLLWSFFCWVCPTGLSEPLPHYSLFFGQLKSPSKTLLLIQ